MRPASDSILGAVERTDVGEDRLTDVLACVAHVDQRFAAVLVELAGGRPEEGERYAVGTQRATPGDRRVDMEIGSYRGLDRTGLVWVDVQAGAAYQPNQLPDYAEQVRDAVHGDPSGRGLTIHPAELHPGARHRTHSALGAGRWQRSRSRPTAWVASGSSPRPTSVPRRASRCSSGGAGRPRPSAGAASALIRSIGEPGYG